MSISENLLRLKTKIPASVTLIAVSKTKPESEILEAYRCGQRHFGENKVQETVKKYEDLPKDICWHFIGHLQTNKVKYIAPFIHLIHGVDSLKLLQEINRQAQKSNRVLNCLLQFHIAQEDTKFGFDFEECQTMLHQEDFKTLNHIKICGVMGMATFTDDITQQHQEFTALKIIFEKLKADYFRDSENFKIISMGMSEDYEVAIAEGSTMVRIGSAIFGERALNSSSF